MPPSRPLLDRFMEKIDRQGGETGCWMWRAGKRSDGYGLIQDGYYGKTVSSHRIAYRLFVGEIPDGMMVMHSCDNKLCVNPSHLSLGSSADNQRDMASKRRVRSSKIGMPWGVRKRTKGCYQVGVRMCGRFEYVGSYKTLEDASSVASRIWLELYQ